MALGELASKKLCATAAPAAIPMTNITELRLPVPICTRCLPGQPSPRLKQSPASVMLRKFQSTSLCAIGWPSKPNLYCPSAKFTMLAKTTILIMPVNIEKSPLKSLPNAPTLQNLLLCISAPTTILKDRSMHGARAFCRAKKRAVFAKL